jgi:hypothetical protein
VSVITQPALTVGGTELCSFRDVASRHGNVGCGGEMLILIYVVIFLVLVEGGRMHFLCCAALRYMYVYIVF